MLGVATRAALLNYMHRWRPDLVPEPINWTGLLGAVRRAQVPEDFLAAEERAQTPQDRDPFATWGREAVQFLRN